MTNLEPAAEVSPKPDMPDRLRNLGTATIATHFCAKGFRNRFVHRPPAAGGGGPGNWFDATSLTGRDDGTPDWTRNQSLQKPANHL